MKIIVSGKQMTVWDSLKLSIEKKLKKFDKFFGDETVANVTCRVRRNQKIVEITILYGGTLFRSEEESETFLSALDRAGEALERQIRKNKTRLEKRVRDGAFSTRDAEDDEEYDEETEFSIRNKTYSLRPMTPEDAILQMNLSGHSFYVFVNAETDAVCAVYVRHGGGYGLLMPET